MNISTKRLPTYEDTLNLRGRFKNAVDPSFIYKLSEEEQREYIDTWFIDDEKSLWTFKRVDGVTASYLNETFIHPIKIWTTRDGKLFAALKCNDSMFGVSCEPPSAITSDHFKKEIFDYIDRTSELNGFDFFNYCNRFEKYNLQTFKI